MKFRWKDSTIDAEFAPGQVLGGVRVQSDGYVPTYVREFVKLMLLFDLDSVTVDGAEIVPINRQP